MLADVSPGMSNEESVGTHRVRVTGDTVLTRYVGVPELEHVRQIHRRFDQALAEHGRLFIINDMRHTGIPSTETRQWIARWAQGHSIAGIANFGASLPIRMLQALVMHASALLGRHPNVVTVHVANEDEAFAWIAARRSSPH